MGNGRGQPGNRIDPFLTSRFRVQIGSGKYQIEAAFTECSGLEVQTEVFEYQEGGLNSYTHKLPVKTKVSNITLKRGIVFSNKLWDWFSKVMNGNIERKNVSIVLHDLLDQPVMRWRFYGCYPVKWSGPNFNANENAITIETLELAAESMDIEVDAAWGQKHEASS